MQTHLSTETNGLYTLLNEQSIRRVFQGLFCQTYSTTETEKYSVRCYSDGKIYCTVFFLKQVCTFIGAREPK